LSTGFWTPAYLLCIPLFLLHFAVFYAASALLAVLARSTAVCMAGSLGFWAGCWWVNNARNTAWAVTDGAWGAGRWLLELAYWALPKPADLNWLLFHTLQGEKYFVQILDYRSLESRGAVQMELSVFTSLAFAVGLLLLAALRFRRADY
jgi:hypothetical protein